MNRTTLLALADRVEKATGADRELDAHVHCVREGLTFVLIGTGNEAYGDICDPSDSGYGSKNTTVRGTLYARYPDNKNPPTLGGGRRGNIVQSCEPARYTASLDAAMSLAKDDERSELLNEAMESVSLNGWKDGEYLQELIRAFVAASLRAIAGSLPD